MCILSAALYVGTPRASRSLEASDGGRWVPGGLGGAVLTLAPPGVSPGASRRLWVPAVWKPLPQTQPRAPLGPQGRCQLCPYLRAHPARRGTSAPTLPPRIPARPPCPPAYMRAHPTRSDWRQTPRVKGSVPQGGPCLGGQSQGQVITCVSACKSGLHAHRLPAPTGVPWLC